MPLRVSGPESFEAMRLISLNFLLGMTGMC
jgi:hypothetical protein